MSQRTGLINVGFGQKVAHQPGEARRVFDLCLVAAAAIDVQLRARQPFGQGVGVGKRNHLPAAVMDWVISGLLEVMAVSGVVEWAELAS
jgi:hypothetical protein